MGQDATHSLLYSWAYDATAANAYGTLETYGGNNDLVLFDRASGNVGIGGRPGTARLAVISGNVGIGTTSPDEKFEVEWVADGTDAEIGRGTTDTDITFIALRNASGTKCYIYPNATGDGITVSTTKP